ncbi:hypothetical protein SAY87_008619 [Trapa incisa]|uniref:Uncharacterized protein n=1 Tax=Trapa incisa TaxID=236973 RepID=A0AAN7PVB1_9MYRT|nr:hypothetical protein SAY87_008619 [Trapa incisa]
MARMLGVLAYLDATTTVRLRAVIVISQDNPRYASCAAKMSLEFQKTAGRGKLRGSHAKTRGFHETCLTTLTKLRSM